jgi:hypothetical protein
MGEIDLPARCRTFRVEVLGRAVAAVRTVWATVPRLINMPALIATTGQRLVLHLRGAHAKFAR